MEDIFSQGFPFDEDRAAADEAAKAMGFALAIHTKKASAASIHQVILCYSNGKKKETIHLKNEKTDPSKQRIAGSQSCNCPFKIAVRHNQRTSGLWEFEVLDAKGTSDQHDYINGTAD